MRYDFDKICDRKNTCSLKWDCSASVYHTEGLLPMWIADMDFPAPHCVAEAIGKRNGHEIYGYTESMPDSLKDAVAGWVLKRHGWKIEHRWLCYTPGVVSALSASVLAFTEPGDRIMIQPPVYPPFYNVIRGNGRIPVTNPLKTEAGRYVMDFDDMERKMKTGVKMMILCSPHNPVGRVWERKELSRLAELCVKNNVLLVSDEIHSDIVFNGHRHIPAASVSHEIEQKSVTCVAASKTFGVAGLTTSATIIPNPELSARFQNQLKCLGIEFGNVFGIAAMEAAYRDGEEWLEQLLEYLSGNLRVLKDYFDTNIPQIKITEPEGTYLVWLDFSALGLDGKKLNDLIVNRAGLWLDSGSIFGAGGEGFQRVNIACPRAILHKALTQLEYAVNHVQCS